MALIMLKDGVISQLSLSTRRWLGLDVVSSHGKAQTKVMNMPYARYRSYLLRIWQERPQVIWHATAQCIQTNEITHFADLELLYGFLTAQTSGAVVSTDDKPLVTNQVPDDCD